MTSEKRDLRPLRRVMRRRDLLPPDPPPRPLRRLTPDALAEELRVFVRSDWDDWLEQHRLPKAPEDDGLEDAGDGGAGTWEQDHPPPPEPAA